MALSGLDIYKLLPKSNCKECGFPTCLAFAMQLAAKKIALDKCIKISDASKTALESASEPPIKLVTIGPRDSQLQVGNETVLFRHEETFYHPTGIGFLIEDTLSDNDFMARIEQVNKLIFHRVGLTIKPDLIALKNTSNDESTFSSKAMALLNNTSLNIILISDHVNCLQKALDILKDRRPLIHAATSQNYEGYAKLAKDFNVPLAVCVTTLDELSELTQKIKALGVSELVLDTGNKDFISKFTDLVNIRRLALKKTFRPLGFPTIAFTSGCYQNSTADNASMEALQGATYIAKYASIVVMSSSFDWEVLPVLTVRQDIYTDPQKPVQVEPRIYAIGNVTKDSPVIVTTNFSITYFTVAGEVEACKVPTYILVCDSEGMSVLTAWAAEKFTPQRISDTLKNSGIAEKVSHKNVIIPGYVSIMSGKLEDLSGWHVLVGPREAAGLASFLKSLNA